MFLKYFLTPSIFALLASSTAHADEPMKWKFILTKGKGVEVCEAYEKRLNNTEFNNYPYCDRPEYGGIEGFAVLNRVPLSSEEMAAWMDQIVGFTGKGNQDDKAKRNADLRKRGLKEIGPALSLQTIKRGSPNLIRAWTYNPLVDMDNDGNPDQILVWHGFGASHGHYRCGFIKYSEPERQAQIIYAVDMQRKRVEELKTKLLFGHSLAGYSSKDGQIFPGFRPVGRTMGIFKYNGIYYFDTFFDSWGDIEGKRGNAKSIFDTLAVFRRNKEKLTQVCEYKWKH